MIKRPLLCGNVGVKQPHRVVASLLERRIAGLTCNKSNSSLETLRILECSCFVPLHLSDGLLLGAVRAFALCETTRCAQAQGEAIWRLALAAETHQVNGEYHLQGPCAALRPPSRRVPHKNFFRLRESLALREWGPSGV